MLQAQIDVTEIVEQEKQEIVELTETDLQWVGGGNGAAHLV